MIEESILANIRNAFASAAQDISIPSMGGKFMFREPSVREHTAFAKTVISNMKSQSVVYAATLAMIKNLCLDRDFEPGNMSEFDRLRVLVHLFSANFFSKNLMLRCPVKACGETIKYSMKYGSLLKMMDSVDLSDIVFDNDSPMGRMRLTANFPKASKYLSLLEAADGFSGDAKTTSTHYDDMDNSFSEMNDKSTSNVDEEFANMIRKRREILKGKVAKAVEEKKDVLGNVDLKSSAADVMMDLADIYIKRVMIWGIKGSDNEFDIDFSGFDYNETEKVLSVLPMGLFTKGDGVNAVKSMTRGIFDKMNAVVPEIKCPKCGYLISKRLTLQDFFIFG